LCLLQLKNMYVYILCISRQTLKIFYLIVTVIANFKFNLFSHLLITLIFILYKNTQLIINL